MELTIVDNSNQTVVPNVITNLISITEQDDLDYNQCKKKPKVKPASLAQIKKKPVYLSIDTIQKMILRFLTEKKMSKKKLAKVLTVKVRDLDRLFTICDLSRVIPKINLPLIKLYCATKWVQ